MDLEVSNKELLKELNKREDYWNNTIKNLSKNLTCELSKSVELQSNILNERQIVIDEIKYMSYELYQFKPILKKYRKLKTEFYLTKYPIKLQGKDKLFLIENDLSLYEQRLEFYDNHIEFLRNCLSNIEQIGYGIKNKITLFQLTNLD